MYKAFTELKNGPRTIIVNGESIKGRWVYGSYIEPNECCTDHLISGVEYLNEYGDFGEVAHKVIPETICEAIPGLKDSEGRQIYNHDVVECAVIRNGGTYSNWERSINKNHGKCRTLPMEVYYTDEYFVHCVGGYTFRPTKEAERLIKEYEKPIGNERTTQHINWYNIKKEDLIKVVGTIFDKEN